MPQELRKIIFSEDELKMAVIDHCMRNGIKLPKGVMTDFKATPDVAATVIITYDTTEIQDAPEVRVSRDDVAAALIRHCGANKIPLPRAARKILKVEDGEVSLMVSIHWAPKKRNNSSPKPA